MHRKPRQLGLDGHLSMPPLPIALLALSLALACAPRPTETPPPAADTNAEAPSPDGRIATSDGARQGAPRGGLRAAIDPDTGEVITDPDGMPDFGSVVPSSEEMLQRSDDGLFEVEVEPGVFKVNLEGRFATSSIGSISDSGEAEIVCEVDHGGAAGGDHQHDAGAPGPGR